LATKDYSGCFGGLKEERRRKGRLQMVGVSQCNKTRLAGNDDTRDREALESSLLETSTEQDKTERVRVYKEASGSRCHSKGSASTTRQLEGTDTILEREALQGGFGDPLDPRSHAVSILVFQGTG
jgi:hypothetical protein